MAKLANIPADCEFPQLREMAETATLAQKLNQYLGPAFAAGDLHVANCAIEQLNYRPGAACVILFTASIRDRQQRELGQQRFYGKLFRRAARAEKIFARQQQKSWTPPAWGPAVVYLPDWLTVLWAYPNDPKVPGVAKMADAEKVLADMRAAPEKFGLRQAPVTIRAVQSKYVPGMRCGYFFHLTLADGAAAGIFGKAYRPAEGRKAFTLMQQIWTSAARRQGRLILPEPYSYDTGRHVLWQEMIAGEPLAKIAERMPDFSQVAQEIGERLAAFHSIPLQLPVERTVAAQVEELRQAMKKISKTFPEYAARCAQTGEKLLAAAAQFGSGPVTPVHASFKFSHIFATAKGIAFIDFDGASLGDPGYDVGRFIAHLYKMKADWKIAPEAAEQTIADFCASYNRAAAVPLSPARINWFAASHLIASQVYKSVKRMDTSLVSRLLKIADQLGA
ncbi:MAG: hypothetical protein ALAOOOJD_01400 [bacterium]|nr:hypothetical protein [bacterium]